MPSNENNNNILPTENVLTEIKFGNDVYEIGLGDGTREAIEGVFEDINDNFELLNETIEDNEEVVSSSLNDLESRKADKTDIPTVPTNVSAFTNDAGYLTQHQSLTDYFNDVAYDSQSKRINFKHDNTVLKYIDATDFIKDGMVDSVAIGNVTIDNVVTRCLTITFNTDSGKEAINIPLTDFFDPDDYYTKDEIDNGDLAIASALNDLESSKLDATVINSYYTKTESDAKYLTSQNVSDFFDDVVFDSSTSRINFKNGQTIKKYIDTTDIFDPDNYYDKDDLDDMELAIAAALNELSLTKLDVTEIDNYYTKTECDAKYLTSQSLLNYYTKDEIDGSERVTASALNDLESRKLDASEMDSYYTKEEIDDADKVVSSALTVLKDALDTKADSDELSTVAISGSYNDLSDKPGLTNSITQNSTDSVTSGAVYNVVAENEYIVSSALADLDDRKANRSDLPVVPTAVSSFTNDAGYLTSSGITGKADKIAIVSHGTSDTTFTLTPNTYHTWDTVSSLTLTLGGGEAGYLSEYMFEFTSGSTATTLSLPNTVKWPATPTIQANMTYQVSIVNNIGLIVGVATS